jgi:hypothetical protein
MRSFIGLFVGFLMCSSTAQAVETQDPTCKGTAPVSGLPLAAEMDEAALKCDVAKANSAIAKSEEVFNSSSTAFIRMVESKSDDGIYVYLLIEEDERLKLDARYLPKRGAPCRAKTTLDEDLSYTLSMSAVNITSPDVPNYDRRERSYKNADGSNRREVLTDVFDIITTVAAMDAPPRHFSRHTQSTDSVADLNQKIISIANQSPDWACN